jgi:hypothetical protein
VKAVAVGLAALLGIHAVWWGPTVVLWAVTGNPGWIGLALWPLVPMGLICAHFVGDELLEARAEARWRR